MRMAESLALASEDPLWFCGCYTASYVVSTALAVTQQWSRGLALKNPVKFTSWVQENWSSLPIRKERRVNGTGAIKLAEIMLEWGKWIGDKDNLRRVTSTEYPQSFKELNPPHHGRYFKTKLYEVLRRTLLAMGESTLPEMLDIIPKGGYHPRGGLRLIYPWHEHKDDSKTKLSEANKLSGRLLTLLQEEDLPVDWFIVEVLLCNYRQAVKGGQYPGRAHDSELGHYYVASQKFSIDKIVEVREKLFPWQVLGEQKDRWQGRRVELGKVMTEYDYVWSDMLYDYTKTKQLQSPRRW